MLLGRPIPRKPCQSGDRSVSRRRVSALAARGHAKAARAIHGTLAGTGLADGRSEGSGPESECTEDTPCRVK